MRSKDTQTSYTFSFFVMTKETMIGMLRAARNGAEMLNILDGIAADVGSFDYIESPMIAEVLGVNQVTKGAHRFAAATLEPIEF